MMKQDSQAMKLLNAIQQIFHKPAPRPAAPLPPEPEPDEIHVPEMAITAVRAAMQRAYPPLLLDVRELYEWQQVRIPGARHMPMNSVPNHLAELPTDQPIIVFCAHGSRSFGVAYYLREQGFDAYNLSGGITKWHIQGGEVEVTRHG